MRNRTGTSDVNRRKLLKKVNTKEPKPKDKKPETKQKTATNTTKTQRTTKPYATGTFYSRD